MRLADGLGVLEGVEPAGSRTGRRTRTCSQLVHGPAYLDGGAAAPDAPFGVGHGLGTRTTRSSGHARRRALITGGSVLAAPGRSPRAGAEHAVNIAGGLHHAMRDPASGFCVFNDAAVAIAWLLDQGLRADRLRRRRRPPRRRRAGRVLRATRGCSPSASTRPADAVPGHRVPGGDRRRGEGAGQRGQPAVAPRHRRLRRGCARSTPSCRVLRAFRPQILVTQCGCDAHHEDPLADLALTVDGQRASYQAMHELAHEHAAGGKWLALGGGGYGLVRCVPRAWTHLIADGARSRRRARTEPLPAWRDGRRRRGSRARPPTADDRGRLHRLLPLGPTFTESASTAPCCGPGGRSSPYFGLDPDDPRD